MFEAMGFHPSYQAQNVGKSISDDGPYNFTAQRW